MLNVTLAQTFTDSPNFGEPAGGAMMLFGLVLFVFAIVVVVALWKLFKKAGQPGWAAIIPIYNTYILLQIAEKPVWWLIAIPLSFIPFIGFFVSLAFSVLIGIEVAKKFGKSEAFGAILCGILGVGYLILGFGDAEYQGPAATAEA